MQKPAVMIARPLLCLVGLSALLAACSPEPETQAQDNEAAGVSNAVVNVLDEAQNAVDTIIEDTDSTPVNMMSVPQLPGWGRDVEIFAGKDIALDPLEGAARLRGQGEMGCDFIADGAGQPIMVTKADLNARAYAIGVVGNGGERQRLVSASAGGFAASGTRFAGRGISVVITLKSRISLTPVGKDSSYPASLTVTLGQDRERVYAGRWVCGLPDDAPQDNAVKQDAGA
ncbi:MAG: hypothetical protein AB7E05_07085 [Sphingobium sp.]